VAIFDSGLKYAQLVKNDDLMEGQGMKFRHLVGGIVVASTGLFSAAASAAPVISNLALSEISVFDAVITGTGATVGLAQVVDGGSIGKTNTIPFGRSSAGLLPLEAGLSPCLVGLRRFGA
jgi:hypothetical protein